MYKSVEVLFRFPFGVNRISPRFILCIIFAVAMTSHTTLWTIWYTRVFHFVFLAFHFAMSLSSKSISFCSLNKPHIIKAATKISQMVWIKNDADTVLFFLSVHFGNVVV